MDRAYLAGASVNPPPVPASPSPGYPTGGNPSTGTPATTPGPYWYHMVMEELMGVISAAGLTPDHEDLTQLAQAVQQLVSSAGKPELRSISATVAANALTVTVQPTTLDFRSATLGSGTVNTRTLAAAASLVVPSGATLGTANGVASRLVVLLLDNAGTLEPAIVNLAGGVSLDETGVISTTAISGAANSASVVYSQAARANLPYRVVGFVDSTQAAAGTWATAPSRVQGAGGAVRASGVSMVHVGQVNGYGSTNTVIRRFTTVYVNQGADITYADSATLGASFTINTPGVYSCSFVDQFNSPADLGISLNSTQLTTSVGAINGASRIAEATCSNVNYRASCGVTRYFSAGDVIRPHTSGVASGVQTASTMFTITRVS